MRIFSLIMMALVGALSQATVSVASSSFELFLNNKETVNRVAKSSRSPIASSAISFTPFQTNPPSIKRSKAKKQRHRISNRNPSKSTIKGTSSHKNVTVKVGESVLLSCVIDASYGLSPGVIWMQGKIGNVLTLNTNRITVDPRFEIVQQPLPSGLESSGRIMGYVLTLF
jgi:hypothetical protein